MTNYIGNYHDDSNFQSSSIEVDGSIFSLSLFPPQQTSQMLSIPIPSLFQLNMSMIYHGPIPVEPKSQRSIISICPYKCSLFPSDSKDQKLPYQSHTFNSPLLFMFHINNLNECNRINHLFNMHSNSSMVFSKYPTATSRSIITLSLLRIARLIEIHHQDTLLLNHTWSMCYNVCNNRGTYHYNNALRNQLQPTLPTEFSTNAYANLKLLLSTLSCISIFVFNASPHLTSKNFHQSSTFPPPIPFLPLIVNRIPAGIG